MGQEIAAWYHHRKAFRKNRPLLRTTILLLVAWTWLTLPWPYTTTAPALLQAQNHISLYTPFAARVGHIHVRAGQHVEKDAVLFRLENPDLQHRLHTMERAITLTRWQQTVQEITPHPMEGDRVLQQTLSTMHTQRQTLLKELKQLRITAPFSGKVVDLADDLIPGTWVAKNQRLLTLIDDDRPLVSAYVAEADLERIPENAMGTFYPEHLDALPQTGRLLRMDHTTTRHLSEPYLASIHGGTLPAYADPAGRLIVEGSFYRSDISLDRTAPIPHISRGSLSITTTPESIVSRLWRIAHAIVIRESGF